MREFKTREEHMFLANNEWDNYLDHVVLIENSNGETEEHLIKKFESSISNDKNYSYSTFVDEFEHTHSLSRIKVIY